MESLELQSQLVILDNELTNYSFDIKDIAEEEKEQIKELYTLIWKSYNNKIFIENIKNSNIRINGKILVNGEEYGNYKITNKTTLHFINCKNTTVIINAKVCHITNERCENFSIKIIGGSVTGMDDIHCKHMNHILENSSVYFLDISQSQNCIFYISERNALDTTISSFDSPDITITMTNPNDGIIKNKYKPSISFFEIYRRYSFEIENDQIQLYYLIPKYNIGRINNYNNTIQCQYAIFDDNKIIVKGDKY